MMPASLTAPKDVQSKLTYVYDDGKRPHLYARPRTRADPHKTDYGASPELVNVKILDARLQKHDFKLDKNAFELVQQETQLNSKDFSDRKLVQSTYYLEIEELIRLETGAAKVVCFHHQVRDGTRSTAKSKSAKEYASDVHTDSSPSSAEESYFEALDAVKEKGEDVAPFRRGRFLYVNAWRNITDTPIQNHHLAVCDETSLVKPDDYIPYDFFEQGYAGVHYNLASRNQSRHRWHYYPDMAKDEVLLFKQFDSDPELPGRMCFHASFEDPTAPADACPRTSIEVRAMAFFPDHEPNTCPTLDGRTRVAVGKILQGVDYVNEWPRMDRWWFMDKAKKGDYGLVLDTLIEDKRNDFGLKGEQDKEFLEDVRNLALDQGFVDHATRSAALLKAKK